MRVIGIDPDSKAHGVAVYENGKLVILRSLELFELYELIVQECGHDVDLVSIENVCGNNAIFRNAKNKTLQGALGRSIGKVQQSQLEVERMLKYLGIDYKLHKISSAWKEGAGKTQFERVTGWTKRSNPDTRSAAYFGFLEAK